MKKARQIFAIIILLLAVFNLSYAQLSRSESDFIYAKRLFDDGLYDLAAEAFENFLNVHPDNPQRVEAAYFIGESYFQDKKYETARSAFQKVALDYPDNSKAQDALFRVADCYREMGDEEKTARALLRIPVFYPKSKRAPVALMQAARILVERKQYTDAEGPVQQVINQYPDYSEVLDAYLLWARIKAGTGELELAASEAARVSRKSTNPDLSANALYYAGEWFSQVGQTTQAELAWKNIIKNFKGTKEHPLALTRLGHRLIELGKIDQAIELFDEAITGGAEGKTLQAALMGKGDASFLGHNYEKALEDYEKAGADNISALFKLAVTSEKLKDNDKALSYYSSVIEGNEPNFKASAAYRTANIYSNSGDYKKAAEYFYLCFEYESSEERKVEALYRGIKAEYSVRPDKIFDKIDENIELIQNSRLADDFKFIEAMSFYKNKEYANAVISWRKLAELYPLSEYSTKSIKYADFTEEYVISDADPSAKVAALLAEVAGGLDQSELSLRLGEIYLRDYKDYEKAETQFNRIIENSKEDDPKLPRVKLLLAESIWRKVESQRWREEIELDEHTEGYHTLCYNEAKRLNVLVETLPLEERPEYAFLAMEMELNANRGDIFISNSRKKWQEYLAEYPLTPLADRVNFLLGQAFADTIAEDSTFDDHMPAIWFLKALREKYSDSQFWNEGSLILGNIYASIDSVKLANEIYLSVYQQASGAEKVGAMVGLLSQADIDKKLGSKLIDELEANASYNPESEKVHLIIAKKYLEFGQWAEAEAKFKSISQDRSLGNPGIIILGSENRKWSFELAQAREGQNKIDASIQDYLQYLAYYPDGEHAIEASLNLARIYYSKQNIEETLRYYTKLSDSKIKDISVREEALRRLAMIAFEQQEYKICRDYAKQVTKITASQDTVFEYRTLATACLYREGELKTGRLESRQLRKDFPDRLDLDNATARFYLEKGKWYSKHKNFPEAEKAYRTIEKKYASTFWAPHALYAHGRDLLIQNLQDQGLEMLLSIEERFPDHPILGSLYMTLGNWYVEHGNLMDGVAAYDKVLGMENYSHLWKAVFANQLTAYKAAGFYAGALKSVQDYLKRFPNAEDKFAKEMEIGRLYVALERFDLAISQFSELQPFADAESEAECQYYIGECLEKQNRYAEAIIEYMKVDYLGKNTKMEWAVTALYSAGRCYEKMGKPDKAIEMYHEIVKREGLGTPFGRKANEQVERLSKDQG